MQQLSIVSRHFTPAWAELLQTPAGHMHALLVERSDALMGCPEGSPEEAELATLTDAIEARPLRVFGNEQGKVYAHTEHPPRWAVEHAGGLYGGPAKQRPNLRDSSQSEWPLFEPVDSSGNQRPPLTLKSTSRCRPASNS